MLEPEIISKFNNICMLSTHGYFDPLPQLGQTDTGGQVVYVLQLAKALAAYGIKVDIYTRWFDQSRTQIDPLPDCSGVRIIRIPAGPWQFIIKENIYDVLPALADNMTEFIRNNGISYDLFHGHYIDAGIVTLDVANAFGKPSFFTAHSLGAWKREQMGGDLDEMDNKYNFRHRITEELRIFKSVTAQTVTTEIQKERIDQLYNFTSDNISAIPPGVDIERFKPLKDNEKKVQTNLPDTYILCLSRIDTNKGHDLLLNAFDIVRKEVPNMHLVIGGGSPDPRQSEIEVLNIIRSIVQEKNLGDQVYISGYIPDELLVASFQQAELFVLPSIFEPFGMTALEAMACGTPVVASKLGGIREVISSGEDGILIDPTNAEEFADAMINLLKDRDLVADMGKKAYKSVYKHYSWDAIARRHIEFYEKYTGK
ncbi:glycosyltransferase [Chloroflexota bacterium]